MEETEPTQTEIETKCGGNINYRMEVCHIGIHLPVIRYPEDWGEKKVSGIVSLPCHVWAVTSLPNLYDW